MTLRAIITLSSDDNTLGAARRFLDQAQRLGLGLNVELLDGAHASIGSSVLSEDRTVTLAEVEAWLDTHKDLPDDTFVVHGLDLAVDLPIGVCEETLCGEHYGGTPVNVTVTTHPSCWDHSTDQARIDEYGVTLVGGQRLAHVHSCDACSGPSCPVHRPTAHSMRGWPQHFRSDLGIIERTCAHGVGHPDPDEAQSDVEHGCDGCCTGVLTQEQPAPQ